MTRIFRYIFVVLLLYFNTSISLGNNIDIDKAVTVIKSLESNVKAIEWDVSINKQQLRKGKTIDSPFQRKSHVLYVPSKRQCLVLVNGQNIAMNSEGKQELSTFATGMSFDGKTYSAWRINGQYKVSSNPPTFGLGMITNSENEITQIYDIKNAQGNDLGITTGLMSLFCNSYQQDAIPIYFSEYIKQKSRKDEGVIIQESSDGCWKILTKEKFASVDFDILIVYDLKKKGIITDYKWSYTHDEVEYILLKYDIQNIEMQDGIWVPHKIIVTENVGDDVINKTYLEYSNIQVYQTFFKDNHFQVNFPNGIHVEDKIKKMYYKVGNPLDEDKAISDFMTRHGLTGNVPYKSTYGNIVRIILITLGGLMILASIILYIRKWYNSHE
ncbi:MAG: hypothetical protein LBE13_01465 [Bacteroidales bacterium]|jgi:hypothetical protein|nr:hypothetical protein [Bacteroidales bacterium]